MVPLAPTSAGQRATPHAESEVTRSLRVLRDNRQPFCVVVVPTWSRALLAEVAEPRQPGAVARLGPLQSSAGAVSAPSGEGGPLGVRSRSEPMIRGTVCTKPARTGLWEPRVGNHPGP